MRNKTRTARMALTGLGLLAALLLVAGPAGAGEEDEGNGGNGGTKVEENGNGHENGPSLGVNANNGSVTSGDGRADNGSVSSGCASANNGSTASGGVCEEEDNGDNGDHKKPRHVKNERGEIVVLNEAGVATPVGVGGGELALTGSSTGPLAATAAGLVVVGLALLSLTSDRRRAFQSLS